MAMKIVVSNPEDGKSYQKELTVEQVKALVGMKVTAALGGDVVGLPNYELIITGGSDKDGFPMRGDMHGSARKKVLLAKGVGFKAAQVGERKRRTVRGNLVGEDIAQLNMKVIKKGKEALDVLMPKVEKKEK